MNVAIGAATDIGQVREGNEDSYLVEHPLFAVADGMGGHRGGEVASRLALDTVQELFRRREGSLTDHISRANSAVFERSQRDRSVSGMGTTLTAALVGGARVHLVHVGDSRAYLYRDGELAQLTEDHTLVHRMVVEGEITPEEAESHPHRSILTRALGVDPSVEVDERDLRVRDGDRVLLCTDGLTAMVPEDRIRDVLARSDDPQEAVEELVRAANGAGGVDNITAVLLAFTERSEPAPGPERRRSEDAPTSSTTTGPAAPARTASRPVEVRRRAIGRKPLLWVGVALAVIVVALVGTRLYLDTQWFVGVSNGRVAIFRGIPSEVAGVELNAVVVETPIQANEAESLAYYRDLAEGITADDRSGANEIVDQIRADVTRAEQPRS